MLNGLERTLHWRDAAESPPPAVGFVIVAQSYLPLNDEPVCRAAYWDGRDFLDMAGNVPIHTVTHWMPYPSLPRRKQCGACSVSFSEARTRPEQ